MIDTKAPESYGWWAERLVRQVAASQNRYRLLQSYIDGNAPLPEGAEGFRAAYQAFQRKARTNFAEIIVEAVQERMTVTGFRVGDKPELETLATTFWSVNEMDIASDDVHGDMLGLGRGVAIVGPPEAASRWDWLPWRKTERIPVITREDPRLIGVEYDPINRSRVISALKTYTDAVAGEDVLHVYLPGRVLTCRRRTVEGAEDTSMSGYEWVSDTTLPFNVVPVVTFENRRGIGEFETHTDVLNRINYMVLQRLVITAMQAFRQRAVIGDLPETDETGDPIDYGSVFRPGPGAVWLLRNGEQMWESTSTDIRPLLEAVKDDTRELAAGTRTPMSMLLPDSQNQSAEGASAAREGLVFKAKNRTKRAAYGWNQVMQLALLFGGQGWQRDIETLWLPPERQSLAERADAASKAVDLPFGTKLRKVWGFSEAEAVRIEQERMNDVFAQVLTGGNGAV